MLNLYDLWKRRGCQSSSPLRWACHFWPVFVRLGNLARCLQDLNRKSLRAHRHYLGEPAIHACLAPWQKYLGYNHLAFLAHVLVLNDLDLLPVLEQTLEQVPCRHQLRTNHWGKESRWPVNGGYNRVDQSHGCWREKPISELQGTCPMLLWQRKEWWGQGSRCRLWRGWS